jgi:DNA-binding MarR family transcriptional regulator
LVYALLDRIEFNNRISTFRQIKLAEELETSQAHISRALKTLMADDIIEKREDDYYFTENFVKFAFDERGKKE